MSFLIDASSKFSLRETIAKKILLRIISRNTQCSNGDEIGSICRCKAGVGYVLYSALVYICDSHRIATPRPLLGD